MKKIIVTILAIAMLFAFVSCGNDSEIPSGMKYACDTDIVDYSFFVPESWEVDAEKGYSMAHVSVADKSSVIVTQMNLLEEYSTLEKWWEKYKGDISSQLGEMREISEGENLLIGGVAGVKYTYKLTLGDTEYKYMVVGTINRGSVYTITYTSKADELFDRNIEDVNKIIENFKFN